LLESSPTVLPNSVPMDVSPVTPDFHRKTVSVDDLTWNAPCGEIDVSHVATGRGDVDGSDSHKINIAGSTFFFWGKLFSHLQNHTTAPTSWLLHSDWNSISNDLLGIKRDLCHKLRDFRWSIKFSPSVTSGLGIDLLVIGAQQVSKRFRFHLGDEAAEAFRDLSKLLLVVAFRHFEVFWLSGSGCEGAGTHAHEIAKDLYSGAFVPGDGFEVFGEFRRRNHKDVFGKLREMKLFRLGRAIAIAVLLLPSKT